MRAERDWSVLSHKVVCIDKDGGTSGQKATGVATILDFSDPIVIVIESTAGYTFKNSTGSTSLKARLYRKGEELDTIGIGGDGKYGRLLGKIAKKIFEKL